MTVGRDNSLAVGGTSFTPGLDSHHSWQLILGVHSLIAGCQPATCSLYMNLLCRVCCSDRYCRLHSDQLWPTPNSFCWPRGGALLPRYGRPSRVHRQLTAIHTLLLTPVRAFYVVLSDQNGVVLSCYHMPLCWYCIPIAPEVVSAAWASTAFGHVAATISSCQTGSCWL